MDTTQESHLIDKISKLQEDFFELNKLLDLGRIVNQSSDLQELCEKLLSFIHLQVNCSNAAIFLENNNEYKLFASKHLAQTQTITIENNNEGIWKVIESGDPVTVKNPDGENIYNEFFDKYNLNALDSSIWLPLIYDEEIIGIITLGNKKNNEIYGNTDFAFFAKVISYIAPVINKYKSKQNKEESVGDLRKTLHNLSILYNISQAMNFIDDLKGLLRVILDKAIKTIGAEKGSLMLYDYSTNELGVKVVYGLPDKEVEDNINEGLVECTKIKVGEGIAGNVFLNKRSIITNLGNNDPRFVKVENSNVSSILCVPLIVKNEAIGVINITNKKDGELFNQHDLEFMEALANQAAIAIDNAQLYELATKDGLTKLYIHRHFHTLLDTEIKRSARYNHKMSLVMMDIDNFKRINDTYGHQAGDQILREISAVIVNTIRKIDVPGRYGGEEFSIILPETKLENSQIITERLRQNIENIKIKTRNGDTISPTVSMGISEYPENGDNMEDLIEIADKALYHSKRSGKNCIAKLTEEGYKVINEQ